MLKLSVGGEILTSVACEELITNANCDIQSNAINSIVLYGFYIINEDTKDIKVKINNGGDMLLKPGEVYDLRNISNVYSCVVTTPNSKVRWGGMRNKI